MSPVRLVGTEEIRNEGRGPKEKETKKKKRKKREQGEEGVKLKVPRYPYES